VIILMNTSAAAAQPAVDLTWVAVAVVVVALIIAVLVMMRRGDSEEQPGRYDDQLYDPAAAAKIARETPKAVPTTQAEEAPLDGARAEPQTSSAGQESEVLGETAEPEPDPETVRLQNLALEAAKKEQFEAKKQADIEARAARKLEREEEAERALSARQDDLAEQRTSFEADRRAAYRIGLSKTRSGFLGKIGGLLSGGAAIDDAMMDDLEAILFTSDIGARTADRLLEELKERRRRDRLKTPDQVFAALREALTEVVDLTAPSLLDGLGGGESKVVMLVGVNGVGKTTSMGKLAHWAKSEGHSVILGAGDTFRAAAVDQLQVWADRTDCPMVRGADNVDPSSVLFDTVKRGTDEGFDLVLCDTAGRLHTRAELMDELKKMHRVMGKAYEGAPHEVILVLDATIGQNAIAQARTFVEAIPVDGIILTKLDGTARGGVIAGICDELKIPVQYIGVGEGVDDLRRFIPHEFVEALFESFGETA